MRLSVGVTGHRAAHPIYRENLAAITETLASILDLIAAAAAEPADNPPAPTRLHSLLADGADQLAAELALQRGWELVAPLPFGANLNCAVNAHPETAEDARNLIAGHDPRDEGVMARAKPIRALYKRALVFELADADERVAAAFLATMENPNDRTASENFNAEASQHVALAARIVVEQSDLVIAIWDGAHKTHVGGTGHTVSTALNMGAAVICIDPRDPKSWRILRAPESLLQAPPQQSVQDLVVQLGALVREAMYPGAAKKPKRIHGGGDPFGASALDPAHWRAHSNPLWHAYRRVEALFSGEAGRNPFRNLRQNYETPSAIAEGSGANVLNSVRASPGMEPAFADGIAARILARFAWSDGISSYLSDTYRAGMVINFVLSALAIVGGIAYLPLADSNMKWAYSAFELLLLSAILFITWLGQKRRWHGRWFETRRVAEYLRHAPILLTLGAARAPGRWPRSADASWPEWYVRHALRELGLPRLKITPAYLRHCVEQLLDSHVVLQRDYHHAKAQRLTNVHHNLDRLSELLFQLAVGSVAVYLGLQTAAWLGAMGHAGIKETSKIFTFLGVLLPTFGGAIAGIRYFGDFERFAAISEVTAQKLETVHARITMLLSAKDSALSYSAVSELAHATDDIVVSEIENWQAVFGGKQITVPV